MSFCADVSVSSEGLVSQESEMLIWEEEKSKNIENIIVFIFCRSELRPVEFLNR